MLLRALATCLLLLGLAFRPTAAASINAEVGDASWIAASGRPPTADDDEAARIATHLRYVLVRLRERSVDPAVAAHRTQALAALERYIERGEFPRRTGDPFAGRRPRFIDDRGVHCAVGQLIADTGAPELARAIAADHEYAYVRDITTPGLIEWARATGFTVDELAMIQPAYSGAPTARGTRDAIESAKDLLALECARQHAPLLELEITVTGAKGGRAVVETARTEPFARCFVERASQLERGGRAYRRSPEPYAFSMTVRMARPAELFRRYMDSLELAEGCWPRPGDLAREARVEIRITKSVLVDVETSPSNPEVSRCLEQDLAAKLRHVVGADWKVTSQRRLPLLSRLEKRRLHDMITSYIVLNAADDCYPPDARPPSVEVTVNARIDDPNFTIQVAEPAPIATCLATGLGQHLHKKLEVRRMSSEGLQPYFRIDADVATTVTVPLPPVAFGDRGPTRSLGGSGSSLSPSTP